LRRAADDAEQDRRAEALDIMLVDEAGLPCPAEIVGAIEPSCTDTPSSRSNLVQTTKILVWPRVIRSDSRRSASFQRDQNAATVEGPHVFTHDGADVPRQIALNGVSRSARINVPCATSASMRSFLVATDFSSRPNRRRQKAPIPVLSAATVPPAPPPVPRHWRRPAPGWSRRPQ